MDHGGDGTLTYILNHSNTRYRNNKSSTGITSIGIGTNNNNTLKLLATIFLQGLLIL